MMQRIAAATVIRGNGGCQVFVDGVVNAELQRQEKIREAERERARSIEENRNDRLAKRLPKFLNEIMPKRGPLKHLKNAVSIAWGMVWAITFGGVWIEMGETLGLWEYVGDEE